MNNNIKLSSEHIDAVNRPTGIVANRPEDGANYAIIVISFIYTIGMLSINKFVWWQA